MTDPGRRAGCNGTGRRLTADSPAPRLRFTAVTRTIDAIPLRPSARRRPMIRLSGILTPKTTVHPHCDLPGGVYDPEQARIEAESCYKIIEKMGANNDPTFTARAIDIKEERAELTKHHLDVLWHDYFKPEHLEKVPNL